MLVILKMVLGTYRQVPIKIGSIMKEIKIMKEIINFLHNNGYTDKVIYRFRDVRIWGNKILISIKFISVKNLQKKKIVSVNTIVLNLDSSNLKNSLLNEMTDFLQRIDVAS